MMKGLWAEECNGKEEEEEEEEEEGKAKRGKEVSKERRRKSEAICFQHRQKETSWWQGMRECGHEESEREREGRN